MVGKHTPHFRQDADEIERMIQGVGVNDVDGAVSELKVVKVPDQYGAI
jgi:hypothetical protein